MKQIFLVFDEKLYFYRFCKESDIQCLQVFSHNKILFLISRILKKLEWKIPSFLWGDWKKEIIGCDKIVITDYAYFPQIVKYIKNRNPHCDVFFYYMNNINAMKSHYTTVDEVVRVFGRENVYTYNKNDAQRYNINFKMTMYQPTSITQTESTFDLLFVGRDKGRGKQIQQFYSDISDKYKCFFRIMDYQGELGTDKYIDYEEYLLDMIKSKAIMEVVTDEQEEISLRVLEALFYDKKLITNNRKFVNLDIYNIMKKNVLIVDYGNIDYEKFETFMNKQFEKWDIDLTQYTFDEWMNSIGVNEN